MLDYVHSLGLDMREAIKRPGLAQAQILKHRHYPDLFF